MIKNKTGTKREPPVDTVKKLQTKIRNVNSELQPEISKSEIKRALKKIKNNKSPGKDGITTEMLKYGGKAVVNTLYILLNKILIEKIIPNDWKESITIILHKKDWEEKGIKIYGQYLNHLRYADDIALITEKKEELVEMLEELVTAARRIDLNMNYTKTKIITNTDENITTRINQENIEQVEEYIYLGQMIKLKKENQTAEIKRRVRLAWAAFGKLSYILQKKKISTVPQNHSI
ncbi:uncharacterized protein LOC115874876 [Sitophilus oryzae]|uniref:Uncharacterized protein LOC115874876 n=1 Tax=Sitophilus oryzae TaxID=7048 RepID=A0A6J2X519_SITOR|nr:uncharacterized protein LOC115874876 [Sitophilus oryzae]